MIGLAGEIEAERSDEEVVGMAQALLASIPRDKAHQRSYRVLQLLAQSAVDAAGCGGFRRFTTKEIYLELGGNKNQEPSNWMSSIWNALDERISSEIASAVIRRCREQGLPFYPRIRKDESSPACYYLQATPIPQQSNDDTEPCPASVARRRDLVIYEPDLDLKLSRLGQLLFSRGLPWTHRKKVLAAAWTLLGLAAVLLVFIGLWFGLAHKAAPISAGDLMLVLVMVGAPAGFIYELERRTRIFDDRIVLAPDWTLAWKEFGATLELAGKDGTETPKEFRVRRYTTVCPVCEAIVKLDKGEPDFPRRLVGRCTQSPREHVFSFDRVTRRGRPLRVPPYVEQEENEERDCLP